MQAKTNYQIIKAYINKTSINSINSQLQKQLKIQKKNQTSLKKFKQKCVSMSFSRNYFALIFLNF